MPLKLNKDKKLLFDYINPKPNKSSWTILQSSPGSIDKLPMKLQFKYLIHKGTYYLLIKCINLQILPNLMML